jgi:hypothetical protein
MELVEERSAFLEIAVLGAVEGGRSAVARESRYC